MPPQIEDVYPMVPMQQSLLSETLRAPGTGMYVEQTRLTLHGPLDVDAFRAAWAGTVARHAALRTGFVWQRQRRPLQVVRADAPFRLAELDWTGSGPGEAAAREAHLAEEDRRQGFDLHRAPLMRLVLIRLGDGLHRLLWSHHHIVLDGWSVGLVLNEVEDRYRAACAGAAYRVEPVRPYRDYVAWVTDRAERGDGEDEEFWRRTLAGHEPVRWPPPHPVEPAHAAAGGTGAATADDAVQAVLGAADGDRLRRMLTGCRLTLSTAVHAAWGLLLARYTGRQDVVFGVTTAARPDDLPGAARMVGLFVNTIPLRLHLGTADRLVDVLTEVQAATGAALRHQHVSSSDVAAWSGLRAGEPLFESVVVVQNATHGDSLWSRFASLEVSDVDFFVRTGFPVMVMVLPGPTVTIRLIHDPSRLDAHDAARILEHLCTLLAGLCDHLEEPSGGLPMLSAPEQEQERRWNRTARPLPDRRPAHRLVTDAARRRPDAVALRHHDRGLTYGELDAAADRLAQVLVRCAVRRDAVVVLLLERSPELVVAMHAVQRAGGAFCVLNPADPPARLLALVEELAPVALVSRAVDQGPFAGSGVTLLDLDDTLDHAAGEPASPPEVADDPTALAYVVFTSGSTGTPKGVQIEHLGLRNVTDHHRRLWRLTPDDTVLQFCAITFDVFILEVFATLACGATLLIVDQQVVASGAALAAVVTAEGVTSISMTPSALETLPPEAGLAGVHTLSVLGERCPAALVRRFGAGRRLFNLYGPAEASIIATAQLCDPTDDGDPPIGRPIDNITARVLAPDGSPLPVGVPGELYLGGIGLARGYAGRPEQTAQVFGDSPWGRQYRTGDVARRRADGGLDFLGRLDHQVKVRGFRVEPAEVEGVMRAHPAVEQVLVVAHGEGSARGLAAYVVVGRGGGREAAESTEQVLAWRAVYEQTYAAETDPQRRELGTAGWRSSYTGEPIPDDEMAAWADAAFAQVRRPAPATVLDLGCGTGMVLVRAAAAGMEVTGTDASARVLGALAARLAADPLIDDARVRLVEAFADDLTAVAGETVDLVVVNSVVQYFPDAEYLGRVLDGALGRLRPGGHLLVGDVRSLPLLEAFHLSVLRGGPGPGPVDPAAARAARAAADGEEELVVHPDFFRRFAADRPGLSVRTLVRTGVHDNEMNLFRYDVMFSVRPPDGGIPPARPVVWGRDATSGRDLEEVLRQGPAVVRVTGLPDERQVELLAALRDADGVAPDGVAPPGRGLRPDRLARLAEACGYGLELLTGSGPGMLEAVLVRLDLADPDRLLAGHAAAAQRALAEPLPWSACVNDPLRRRREQRVVLELHGLLAERLPSHLRPDVILPVPRIPLTPNGKVDRAALPSPTERPSPVPTSGGGAVLAPRDSVELAVERIWADVLGLEQIGVGDNFFQVGGNSLLAMLVTGRIAAAFRCDLDLRSVFARPTIREIAQLVREGRTDLDPAVPLRREGRELPFFLWHAAGGNVLAYQPLVRALGPQVPVWGFEELDPATGARTVEEMATGYEERLRAVQPSGPYRLGGWSFGGLLAYEVAQRLRAAAEVVDLVVLFDSSLPASGAGQPPPGGADPSTRRFLRFASYLGSTYQRPVRLDPERMVHLSEADQLDALVRATVEAGILTCAPDEVLVRDLYAAYRRSIDAASWYRPGPSEGPVVLYRAADELPEPVSDLSSVPGAAALGWARVCPRIEVVPVPGNHLTLLDPVHVPSLAADLGPRLSQGWGHR